MTSLDSLLNTARLPDPKARQRAALALGTVDTTPVMADLVYLMATEPEDFVRETLVWAVVARPQAATRELVAALRLDLPLEPVLHALSKIGDPGTARAVRPFADDADDAVAAKAWWALARIGTPDVLDAMLPHLGAASAARRHGLTRALLQLGEPALAPLAAALDSEDAAVRSHAAEVLVAFADPTRYGLYERRTGRDYSGRAADIVRSATAPEVDGALLLATVSDDHPGLVAAAQRLRDERS